MVTAVTAGEVTTVAAMMVTTIKKSAGYNPQIFTLH
jgi:hypothetical protein